MGDEDDEGESPASPMGDEEIGCGGVGEAVEEQVGVLVRAGGVLAEGQLIGLKEEIGKDVGEEQTQKDGEIHRAAWLEMSAW